MDFFEAQARAKKRTSRLVVLFSLAVAGTIVAAYAAGVLILRQVHQYQPADDRYGEFAARSDSPPPLWQPKLFGGVALGTIAVVGLASLFKWKQFSAGGSAVAKNLGGRLVDSRTGDFKEKRLVNVVEEMAIASGTPVPAVYVLDDEPGLNAFAAGLTTSDAVVAVTRGLLEKLNRDELQGVIAHEFSHILNGDMRLNVRLSALLFGILVLGIVGRSILWGMRFSGRGRRSRGKGGGGVLIAIIVAGLALLIIGYVGYFFGRLIQAAVSRQREFLADASAVQFTRNPTGIAGALKKIGGYALGSSMNSTKSAEIGHFFFAQGFRSMFGGWWATHPPLPERIRAIDPNFDGQFFEPPEMVDVSRESFVTAGLTPPKLHPASQLRAFSAASASAAVSAVGTLSEEQLASAHVLLEATPVRLRDAAHDPAEAPVVLFGLLLSRDPAVRARQRKVISDRAGADALRVTEQLEPEFAQLAAEQRLPLLQLALPAVRQLPDAALDAFLDTLDELVHADAHVSSFEFALQKLLTHTLALGRKPGAAVTQFHSFHAVSDEISIVLSALARASASETASAAGAFECGAVQLKLVTSKLRFLDESTATLESLDTALDKLALASLPIKHRTLIAAAHVVSADGQVLITEAELLRAIAAALDCPMPPLTDS